MSASSPPLVTIGIPTYNRADGYLRQALESAVKQTYANVEIIVSDNCSTDDTESLVHSFVDSRITYVKHAQNIGAINNFNYCVEKANGDYFLMLHDDDLLDSDLLEVCMEAVDYKSDIGVILTGTRLIDQNGGVVYESVNRMGGASTLDFFIGWFNGKVPLYLCSTLYNTKRLKELGSFKSKTNHFLDVVATVRLAARYGRADVFETKASFRRHGGNMGGDPKKIEAWSEDCLYLLDIMCSLVPDPHGQELLRQSGLPFFSIKNYRLASKLPSLAMRTHNYIKIYIKFNMSYSPLRFIYNQKIVPIRVRVIHKVKKALLSALVG